MAGKGLRQPANSCFTNERTILGDVPFPYACSTSSTRSWRVKTCQGVRSLLTTPRHIHFDALWIGWWAEQAFIELYWWSSLYFSQTDPSICMCVQRVPTIIGDISSRRSGRSFLMSKASLSSVDHISPQFHALLSQASAIHLQPQYVSPRH